MLKDESRTYFQRYPTMDKIESYDTKEKVESYLNDYFTKIFPDEFLQFSIALVKKISWDS